MRHYTGGVAFDVTGRFLAASSPRGHLVTFWHVAAGDFLGQLDVADASGVVSTDREAEFLVSSGTGSLQLADARRGTAKALPGDHGGLKWDNHISSAFGG
jgi:hypothetical protein